MTVRKNGLESFLDQANGRGNVIRKKSMALLQLLQTNGSSPRKAPKSLLFEC
ncbi:hypothetical protein CCP3SC1_210027 [Gammaproteobacteria bacterium]